MEKPRHASIPKIRSKHHVKEEKITELANKIDETDEMKLKMLAMLDKPSSDDILYPPELNAQLIEQLKVRATYLIILELTNPLNNNHLVM